MTVHGNVYHYLDVQFPPQKIKHFYASVHAYDTNETERALVRGSNFGQQLNQGILIDLGAAITQSTTYAQAFQILHKWTQRDSPDECNMIIHAYKRPAGKNARRYNSSESSDVAVIIVGVED